MNAPFKKNTIRQGLVWLGVCSVMLAIVATASHYGLQQWAVSAIIILFAVRYGLWPYLKLAFWFRTDDIKNRETIRLLTDLTKQERQQLVSINTQGGGSVLTLAVWVARNLEHMSAEEATNIFIDELRKVWRPMVDAQSNASHQSPVLGFAASLYGLLLGVGKLVVDQGGDQSQFYEALQIMLQSSMVGACCAFVCIGLWLLSKNACKSHEADLRKLSSQLGGDGPSIDPDRLF